jgi:hypothetical protein
MGEARPLDAVANDRPAKRPKSDPGDAAGTVAVSPTSPPSTPLTGTAIPAPTH